jgi:hypothetical protein
MFRRYALIDKSNARRSESAQDKKVEQSKKKPYILFRFVIADLELASQASPETDKLIKVKRLS